MKMREKFAMKQVFLCAMVLGCALVMMACNRASGLSENEDYLNFFAGRDNLAGIVIGGEFYELPQRFGDFIDRGWEVGQRSLESLNITELATVYLPAEGRMDLQVSRAGLDLDLSVVNLSETEDVNLMEATVVYLSSGRREKDSIVVYGGITFGTIPSAVQDALQDFDISERLGNFQVSSGSVYQEVLTLNIGHPIGEVESVGSIIVS